MKNLDQPGDGVDPVQAWGKSLSIQAGEQDCYQYRQGSIPALFFGLNRKKGTSIHRDAPSQKSIHDYTEHYTAND